MEAIGASELFTSCPSTRVIRFHARSSSARRTARRSAMNSSCTHLLPSRCASRSIRQVPLAATPLSTFLARTVRLDQGVRIDRVTRMQSGAFAITARDQDRPNEGSVILAFAGSPLRLQEWTITDAQGARTRTQLTSLAPASGLAASLFQLRDPTRRPGRN